MAMIKCSVCVRQNLLLNASRLHLIITKSIWHTVTFDSPLQFEFNRIELNWNRVTTNSGEEEFCRAPGNSSEQRQRQIFRGQHRIKSNWLIKHWFIETKSIELNWNRMTTNSGEFIFRLQPLRCATTSTCCASTSTCCASTSTATQPRSDCLQPVWI